MKVGLIAPINLLDTYCTPFIQYCIPRLLVDSSRYRQFYVRKRIKGSYIILDCKKLGWKREPEDSDTIIAALDMKLNRTGLITILQLTRKCQGGNVIQAQRLTIVKQSCFARSE